MVDDGDPVCEVESMKVNIRVNAPAAGKILWLTRLGEVVGEGEVLAEIVR